MEEFAPWLAVLPLVLALIKFGAWVRAQIQKQLEEWIARLIDKKLETRKESVDKQLGAVDFALREELQKHTLQIVEQEKANKEQEPRLQELETRTDLLWGLFERSVALQLRKSEDT